MNVLYYSCVYVHTNLLYLLICLLHMYIYIYIYTYTPVYKHTYLSSHPLMHFPLDSLFHSSNYLFIFVFCD